MVPSPFVNMTSTVPIARRRAAVRDGATAERRAPLKRAGTVAGANDFVLRARKSSGGVRALLAGAVSTPKARTAAVATLIATPDRAIMCGMVHPSEAVRLRQRAAMTPDDTAFIRSSACGRLS